ncbi:MAG: hypothetical protein J7484_14075 [Microbacterium sp.]|nr:hypothetical protein [Microbacterium sp.]
MLIVVTIIGVMLTVAIGSLSGMAQGMNDSMVQSSLQATRVSLAATTVRSGTLPNSGGTATALPNTLVMVPKDSGDFKIGYVPFCFQIIDNTGATRNRWVHNGLCTAADRAAGTGGVKPLVENDFVLCAQYRAGAIYAADTWHSVHKYTAGAKWPDNTTMELHGCTPKPITDSNGTIPPQI